MIISASAIGGDLLFESSPVDVTVYKKVLMTHYVYEYIYMYVCIYVFMYV